jgi:hypothetical protein
VVGVLADRQRKRTLSNQTKTSAPMTHIMGSCHLTQQVSAVAVTREQPAKAVYFRIYGVEQDFLDKKWVLNDFE